MSELTEKQSEEAKALVAEALAEREARVAADQHLVNGVFNDFLRWLAAD